MKQNPLSGLYAITDASLLEDSLIEAVEAAINGGARIVQYRNKSADPVQRRVEARALAALCEIKQCLFIVNDDPELAVASGADGVHLGQDDGNLRQARQTLGQDRIIGISCYNSIERAQDAVNAGADYIAFGSFFPSDIKPDAVRARPELIKRAKQELDIPVAAIGGITTDNASELLDQGVDMLAVISAVFAKDDVRQAARSFEHLFDQHRHQS